MSDLILVPLELQEMETPVSDPPSGFSFIYFKNDNKLYKKVGSIETQIEGSSEDIIVTNVDPDEFNDSTEGRFIGQRWVNTVKQRIYGAVDVTPDNAVWKEITPIAGISTGTDGELVIDSGVTLGTATTYSISINEDNLVVPDIEKAIVLRLDVSGNTSLTGLVPFNDTKAWMLFVCNVGSGNLSMKNNDLGSDANNRFLMGGNKTVQTNEGMLLFYDPISNRWRGAGIII